MRCMFCGKDSPGEYCSEECLEECRRFEAFARRHEMHFLAGVLIPCFGLIASVPLLLIFPWGRAVFSAMIAAMGVVTLAFPFATPDTVRVMGVRRSVRLVRALSSVMLAMALLIYFL